MVENKVASIQDAVAADAAEVSAEDQARTLSGDVVADNTLVQTELASILGIMQASEDTTVQNLVQGLETNTDGQWDPESLTALNVVLGGD